jgi:hypothetical protein
MNKLVWLVLLTLAGFGVVIKGFIKHNEPNNIVEEGLWI